MSGLAIRVEGLWKEYALGAAAHTRPHTVREAVTNVLSAPLQTLKRIAGAVPDDHRFWALRDVSFEVRPGEVVGIIGPNGAGKSTLLKILSRITAPSRGRAEFSGRLASLLEVGTGFHPELTGRENIFLNGAILGMSRREVLGKFDEIVAFAEVERFIDTPVKRFSSGMYVRLAFSVAAHLEPEILIVDEVLAVGDAAFQAKCLGKLGAAAKGGRTVLFVSHNLAAVRSLCSRAILLKNGGLFRSGDADAVVDEYLSLTTEAAQAGHTQFPVFSEAEGIGFDQCVVSIEPAESPLLGLRLRISLKVKAMRQRRGVGVGFRLVSASGVLVTSAPPAMTSHTLDLEVGSHWCEFLVDDIGSRLVGGQYVVGVWLAIPRIQMLLNVDDAAMINLPARDIYGNGLEFDQRWGVVPVHASFCRLKQTEVPLG